MRRVHRSDAHPRRRYFLREHQKALEQSILTHPSSTQMALQKSIIDPNHSQSFSVCTLTKVPFLERLTTNHWPRHRRRFQATVLPSVEPRKRRSPPRLQAPCVRCRLDEWTRGDLERYLPCGLLSAIVEMSVSSGKYVQGSSESTWRIAWTQGPL